MRSSDSHLGLTTPNIARVEIITNENHRTGGAYAEFLLSKLSYTIREERPALRKETSYSTRIIPGHNILKPCDKLRRCIQKFPDWVHNEINNNKHSLRSNTKGYGGKTH